MLTSNTKFHRNPPQEATDSWNKYNVPIAHSIYERRTSNIQNQPGMEKGELLMAHSIYKRRTRNIKNQPGIQKS